MDSLRNARPLGSLEDYLEVEGDDKESSDSWDEASEEDDGEDMDSDEADDIYQLVKPLLNDISIENKVISCAIDKCRKKERALQELEKMMSPFRRYCHRVALNLRFTLIVFLVVMLNIVVIVCQSVSSIALEYKWYLTLADQFCLGVYIVEFVLKIYALRMDYFKDGFNVWDLIVLGLCALDLFGASSYGVSLGALKAFRTFRSLKALRVMKSSQFRYFKSILALLSSIIRSAADCASSMVLLLFIMYVYAFVGLTLYREVSPDSFGDFFMSFFSMFQLCTFDDWLAMYESVRVIPEGHILFFITFMILCSFLILNYVTAVLTDNACSAAVKVSNNENWVNRIIKKHREEQGSKPENVDATAESHFKMQYDFRNMNRIRLDNITEILSLLGEIESSKMISDAHAAILGELTDAALSAEY